MDGWKVGQGRLGFLVRRVVSLRRGRGCFAVHVAAVPPLALRRPEGCCQNKGDANVRRWIGEVLYTVYCILYIV